MRMETEFGLRNTVFKFNKNRTMDDVQKVSNCINILSRVYDCGLIITGFGLDLLTASFTITLNHNQLQEIMINLQPNPSSLNA
jgi:hypothetical protein